MSQLLLLLLLLMLLMLPLLLCQKPKLRFKVQRYLCSLTHLQRLALHQAGLQV